MNRQDAIKLAAELKKAREALGLPPGTRVFETGERRQS